MFIPGMCRVWSRRTSGSDQHWYAMPNAARGYHDCEHLVDTYHERFGNQYMFAITADHDLCRPGY